MNSLEKKINNLPIKECSFQKNSEFKKKMPKYKEIDKIQIINENLYIYILDNAIKVYDCLTFKEKAVLELPFTPSIMEITDNNSIILYADDKLYLYKYNLDEGKLNFVFYLPDIYFFSYLYQKKEILLLMNGTPLDGSSGMAKIDLSGKIILFKSKKPEVIFNYVRPKTREIDFFAEITSYKFPRVFSYFNGFNQDKYIINVTGYSDNYYVRFGGEPMEDFNISILNSDNLDVIFQEDYQRSLSYIKITDNLFKTFFKDPNKKEDVDEVYYYDEKENKIEFFKNKIQGKYFYLRDNIFAVFSNPNIVYIIDLSQNEIIKKFTFKEEGESFDIKNICYNNYDGNEYVYLLIESYSKEESKIISGIII